MKLVSFTAGLGNQLFQYCFYRYLLNKFPNEKIYGYYNKKWLEKHGGIIIAVSYTHLTLPTTPYV